MGAWNLPPSSLPSRWARGVGGLIAAASRPARCAGATGSLLDCALVRANHATRVRWPLVIDGRKIKVHQPAELPVLAEDPESWTRAVVEPQRHNPVGCFAIFS